MQQVLATRTPEGWRSEEIVTPQEKPLGLVHAGNPPEYQFFSPELSLALVQPVASGEAAEPPLAAGVTQATMYVRDDANGHLHAGRERSGHGAGHEVRRQGSFCERDAGSRSCGAALDGGAGGRNLAHGRSTASCTSGPKALCNWLACCRRATLARKPELGFSLAAANAISSDGSRVIFTNQEENTGVGHLYMRDTRTGQTLQLDAAQGIANPPATGGARFQTATSDGSRVFFTDYRKLTPDATPQEAGRTAGPLRVRDRRTSRRDAELQAAGPHGRYAGRRARGCAGLPARRQRRRHDRLPGGAGVLARNRNAQRRTRRSGPREPLSSSTKKQAGNGRARSSRRCRSEDQAGWGATGSFNASFLTARVSPNGRYLAFMSQASLTGYDNEDVSSRQPGERMDEEVYLYDAQAASLTCVSCDPTGARPHGVLDEVRVRGRRRPARRPAQGLGWGRP